MSAPFIRRHLGFRLLLLGLSLVAGLAVYQSSRPVFSSRALVRLGEGGSPERVRTLAKELTTPQLLERTASRLGVRVPASELRRTYLFDIAAQPVSAREIEVEVWAYSKEWAERWVEALVRESLDFRRARQRKETLDAVRVLNKEMGEIGEKFGNSGLKKFDATDQASLTRQLADLDELRNPARVIEPLARRIDALSRLHADLLNSAIPLVEKLSLLAAFEKASSTASPESPPAWQGLEQRRRPLVELLTFTEFASLAPAATLLALGDQIEELDQKLQVEFDAKFHPFDVDYRNLVDRKAALEAKAAQPNGPADSALNLRLRHIAQRIETLGTGDGDAAEDPTFAGLQKISDRPVSPNILKIALLSLLGGGVLALGVPSLLDRFGPGRVKIAQLASRLGLRALGSIPAIPNLPPRQPALAEADDERSAPLVECFREIRASLLADGETPRALMITSAMPGEGKTLVAANLGIAFAASGVRTLVIDTDLRRGRLHRLFGYRPAPGLANVLAGELSAEKAIRPTSHENLCVMNAGKAPAPGGDLLASAAFAQTITELRGVVDLLIFDAPPVLGLAATASLAPYADAALIVVSSGKFPLRAASAAIGILRGNAVKVTGFILNRAPAGM